MNCVVRQVVHVVSHRW